MQIGLEPSARPFLIRRAQASVAGHIGNQDGGESALHAPFRASEKKPRASRP
jgi:hypothetical protein